MSTTPVLLVMDDEPGMLSLVERAVVSTGYRTVLHTSVTDALVMLGDEPVDVVLVDLRMPELGGLDILRAIQQLQPECGVVLMAGQAREGSAVDAVNLGALDYLTKPLDFARLQQVLNAARDEVSRRAELFASEGATARRLQLCGMIGRSAIMQQLFALVRRIAPHARTALITGETGAGKEGIARAIHELGPQRERMFATVDCSAVVETLFEVSCAGTLFLDEVGELLPGLQETLLEVMERGDVRIVAATSRDLRTAVEAGRFRSDLFYRLSAVELHVPPLRERREDIPYLTAAFVKEFGARFGKPIEGVSTGAEQLLMSGAWLGNVRELRNALERACMVTDGHLLIERDLAGMMPVVDHPSPAGRDLDQVEREHIVRVLADVNGNKQAAARRLGISRRTLYRRLERHGLGPTPAR